MCGIVGLFAKSAELEATLGQQLSAMLVQLSDRGPDSAGIALYRDSALSGLTKLTLYSPDPKQRWKIIGQELAHAFGGASEPLVRGSHAVFAVETDVERVETWISAHYPELRVRSAGMLIEIYKETGRPEAFAERLALTELDGTHGIGHTRMATESHVQTEASHPFVSGLDLCVVHNGSLSNHNRLRRALQREGIEFATDNDSEVAAGFLASELRGGATLHEALEACLADLDGFYTFLVGTSQGFAVLRDPIACKPAVIAESEEWVAVASEYRAIAVLPGAAEAESWEPEPGHVHVWERERVS